MTVRSLLLDFFTVFVCAVVVTVARCLGDGAEGFAFFASGAVIATLAYHRFPPT